MIKVFLKNTNKDPENNAPKTRPPLKMGGGGVTGMIDSDRRPDSNRRPLLKSASTDVIISNHGPILGYSQIGILSKLAYL